MKNDTINPANYTAHLHPGKFEGETAATEYFYEQYLAGDGEAIYQPVNEDILKGDPVGTLFHVNAEEWYAFEIPIGHWFLLWEDSHGFVYGKVYPTHNEAVSAFHSNQ